MYEQVIQPNLSVVGVDGACLVYVREVFGVAAKYQTALVAWQNAQYQHPGTPPSNVAMPIWFNWETDGHVAVWNNGTIYSTTAQGDKTFSSIQALMDYIGEGIEYLGWSEDINGVRVVQPQGDDMYDGQTAQEWAAIANDAVPYKEGVVNSKGWADPYNFSETTVNITPAINNLIDDRVAVATALGLPVTADATTLTAAIQDLSGNPTLLAPGIYQVKP